MNLISLHTVSVIHSLYVHLLSRSKSKIRWMLNLYVNFNIEAILYLKNKINASISFLMWNWMSSLLEKNYFRMHPPQIPISEGRGVLEEAILPFADGLFRICFNVPTVSFTISVSGVNSKGSDFFLKLQWSLFANWILRVCWGCWTVSRVSYIPQAKPLDLTKTKLSSCWEKLSFQKTWVTAWWFQTTTSHLHWDLDERFQRSVGSSFAGKGRNLCLPARYGRTRCVMAAMEEGRRRWAWDSL